MAEIIDIKAEKEKLKEKIKRDMEMASTSVVDTIGDIDAIKSNYPNREAAERDCPDLRQMNASHAFVRSYGGKAVVTNLVYNEFYKKEIIEFLTPETIQIIYCNRMAEETLNDKKGALQLGKWWLLHPHRKEYATVTFEPSKPPGEYHRVDNQKLQRNDVLEDKFKTYFNLWEGFAVEPVKGCWKNTLKHIYNILCNSDSTKFKYVMRWLAWSVQNPGTRAEVALIFKGKKGAGKGVILQAMCDLFGRHGLVISNREHLTGKHNEHLATCSFLFADEAYYPGDKEAEGIMKNIITEKSLTTEPKFKGLKIGNNCLHIAMATNSDWVISAGDDERRYFINEVDNKYSKNAMPDNLRQRYFNKIWKELDSAGLSAILYDLQHMQLGEWHPRHDVPETEELRRQIAMSLPKLKYAFLSMIEDGVFPGALDGQGRYIISNKNLTGYFHSMDPANKSITTKQVAKLCSDLGITTDRDKHSRFYVFPQLGELRKAWNFKVAKVDDWSLSDAWEVNTAY